MGIDINIIHKNGGDATDLFSTLDCGHIVLAINAVAKTQISVGTRHDCYQLIALITDHWLCGKYDQEDPIWRTAEFKEMLRCLERNLKNDEITYNNDVDAIQQFLEFLIYHELYIQIW